MTERTAGARELWALLEPIHAVTYFSPEPLEAFRAAGCAASGWGTPERDVRVGA